MSVFFLNFLKNYNFQRSYFFRLKLERKKTAKTPCVGALQEGLLSGSLIKMCIDFSYITQNSMFKKLKLL